MKTIALFFALVLTTIVFAQKKEKTYKVLTACGQCQFEIPGKKGCDLAIQLAGKYYWVDGTGISDHGDMHAPDGFCNAVRKAEVKGNFDGDRIAVSSFILISPKKKKKKDGKKK